MKIETTTSSHDVMNANSAPATTPGRMIGKVIRQNVRTGSAPRLAAASSRLRSMVRRIAPTLMITNGTARAVCARTMPGIVPVIFVIEKNAKKPIAMMITGTMSGLRMSALAMPLPGNRPRTTPSAPSVPRIVDRTAVSTATWTEFTKLRRPRAARRAVC